MSRGRMVLVGVLALLLLLAAGVAWYLGPIAPVATGYAAKTLCSGVFVSDRPAAAVEEDLPANPLVPFLRTSVDDDDRAVRTTLLGAWGSTAYATEGLGCTLADERPAFEPPQPVMQTDPSAAWPAGDGPAQLPVDVDAAELDAAIATAFTEDDPEGRRRETRAVVVVKDGQLIAERYADGFDATTPQLGWSMTKSVASAMVGRLVGAGQLSPADADLRRAWQDDDRRAITLDHLLTMTSGLTFEEVYEPDTDATRMLFRPGDVGAYAAAKPLEHPPGTEWAYSSGTTNIICDIAHDVSGLGPEMATELVFAPLGMSRAVLEPDATGGLACSSFMYATARDWARFGQWYLQDGEWDGQQLLPEGWVDYSTTPVQHALEHDRGYGAQWWTNEVGHGGLRMPTVPPDAYWASGNEGQQLVVIPSEDLVVVRLGLTSDFEGLDWGLERLLVDVIAATR